MKMTKSTGLYIHIPFCISKCNYCDFYSFPKSEEYFEKYRNRVCDSLDFYKNKYARSYNSLYFGGGTPIYFGSDNLTPILDNVRNSMTDDAEITVEGNPGLAGETDFEILGEHGVNRYSFGLQSANQNELKALGRIHTAEDAEKAVKYASHSCKGNISLDIMLGIPYQTKESLGETIRFCADLNVKHISAYMLKIEDNTPLATSELRNFCANDDNMAELYLFAVDELERYGYNQYEISNFAVPGFESKHNLKYWMDEEYVGIGPSAHSFIDNRRYYFDRDINKFLNVPYSENEIFESEGGGWEEYAMLRLRLTKGLNIKAMSEIYPDSRCEEILERAARYEKSGLLKVKDNTVCFTPKGFLLSNSLTAELLYG